MTDPAASILSLQYTVETDLVRHILTSPARLIPVAGDVGVTLTHFGNKDLGWLYGAAELIPDRPLADILQLGMAALKADGWWSDEDLERGDQSELWTLDKVVEWAVHQRHRGDDDEKVFVVQSLAREVLRLHQVVLASRILYDTAEKVMRGEHHPALVLKALAQPA